MLHSSTLVSSAVSSGLLLVETITTRFGDIVVDTGKSILFQRGLLGMPDKTNFVLANFPSEKMEQFKLLQSLDDTSLSFITLPLDLQNPIIAADDLRSAGHEMQITEAHMAILLVVSVHRSPDQVRLSVNARAPLLLDASRKTGVQYVIPREIYKIQHML
jgi:flagellar assembly factor FliW